MRAFRNHWMIYFLLLFQALNSQNSYKRRFTSHPLTLSSGAGSFNIAIPESEVPDANDFCVSFWANVESTVDDQNVKVLSIFFDGLNVFEIEHDAGKQMDGLSVSASSWPIFEYGASSYYKNWIFVSLRIYNALFAIKTSFQVLDSGGGSVGSDLDQKLALQSKISLYFCGHEEGKISTCKV